MSKHYVILLKPSGSKSTSTFEKVECKGSIVSGEEICKLIGCKEYEIKRPSKACTTPLIYDADPDRHTLKYAPNPLASLRFGYAYTGKYLCGNVISCAGITPTNECLAFTEEDADTGINFMHAGNLMARIVNLEITDSYMDKIRNKNHK